MVLGYIYTTSYSSWRPCTNSKEYELGSANRDPRLGEMQSTMRVGFHALWFQCWYGCLGGLCTDGVQDGKVSPPDISISLAKTPRCLYTTFSTPTYPAWADSSAVLSASMLHCQLISIRQSCFPPS